jgi:ATP-binding cassette subfamily B multidrug efflux pump
MFAWFERKLLPTLPPQHPEPPAGLMAFYWHYARQAKGLFVALFVAGFFVALLDSMIPVFIGRVVTAITASKPEEIFATYWPHLVVMAVVLLLVRPLALTMQNILNQVAANPAT